jgi:hypothetical protein
MIRQSRRRLIWLVGGAGLAIALAGCAGPQPFLLNGDADSAEVGFSGDPGSATPVAKQHCARYERVPHFVQADPNVAYFDCVKP